MVGLAQVDVLSARPGEERRQLREGERAGEGDRAAGGPRREHETGGREPLRHDRGHDEDSGPNDSADDDHGGVERSERAAERHFV